jgi:predicted GIY-YIG superfamily endonuclease
MEIVFVEKNKVSNHKNTRAQPYVTEKYAKEWIYDLDKIISHRATLKENAKQQRSQELKITRLERKEVDISQLLPLPDIVHISNEEAFKDIDGTMLPIEMRGEKTSDGLYLKALDIQNQLGILDIQKKILHIDGTYEYDEHYVFFMNKSTLISDTSVPPKNTSVPPEDTNSIPVWDTHGPPKNTSGKALYLTYFGVVKLLISSRSPNTRPFQKWVITTLFTHQFGDQDEKDVLASSLMGITPKTLCDVFRKSSSTIPCVYLFKIGKVCDILEYCKAKIESINLDGYDADDIVYKFGMTDDLARRSKEHSRSYGKMTKDFSLETFNYIDKALACKAEKNIKDFFNATDMRVDDKKHIELVVIKPSKMQYVNEWFKNVQRIYAGNSADLIKQIDDMRHEHAMELVVAQNENKLLTKENEKMFFQHKSALQDMQIEMLRGQIERSVK